MLSNKFLNFILLLPIFMWSVNSAIQNEGDLDNTVTWDKLLSTIRQEIGSLTKQIMPSAYRALRESQVDRQCEMSLIQFGFGLRGLKPWAIKMVDAYSKIPSGILEGTVTDLGSYDECLAVKVMRTKEGFSDKELFRGKHCMMSISSPLIAPLTSRTKDGRTYLEVYGKPPEWIEDLFEKIGDMLSRIPFLLGICIPSKCSGTDMENFLKVFLKPLHVNVSIQHCEADEPYVWTNYQYASIAILSCLLAVIGIGTMTDIAGKIFKKQEQENDSEKKKMTTPSEKNWITAVKAFSVYANVKKFLKIQPDEGKLGFLYSILFFSTVWIILGNCYILLCAFPYPLCRNLLNITELFGSSLPAAIIENFMIAMSCLFFISGFTTMYTLWPEFEKTNGKINMFSLILRKYFSLTPSFAFLLLGFLLSTHVSSGPMWLLTAQKNVDVCAKNWWINLLYLNNWWNQEIFEQCLPHTWYLAALMQIHTISIVIIFLAFRKPRLGVVIGCLIFTFGCGFTFFIVAYHNFPMPRSFDVKNVNAYEDYTSLVNMKPFAHVSTYVLGMYTAYLVLKRQDHKLKKITLVAGSIFAILIAFAALFGLYGPSNAVEVRSAYNALYGVTFATSLAWLTFVCGTGNGGIVNKLLSWKVFYPLGRLSLQMYLFHPLVIGLKSGSSKDSMYYGHMTMVYLFLAVLVISCAVASVSYVIVELPFSTLQNMVITRGGMTWKRKNSNIYTVKEFTFENKVPIKDGGHNAYKMNQSTVST